jgi:hypothetical protein
MDSLAQGRDVALTPRKCQLGQSVIGFRQAGVPEIAGSGEDAVSTSSAIRLRLDLEAKLDGHVHPWDAHVDWRTFVTGRL